MQKLFVLLFLLLLPLSAQLVYIPGQNGAVGVFIASSYGSGAPTNPCHMTQSPYTDITGHAFYFCGSEGGTWSGVGGIVSLNGISLTTQTFANANDTNVTLGISSASSTHTFTLGWTGTLAKARQNGATVYNDAANTGTSSMTIDLSLASALSGLKVPAAAGAIPVADGAIAVNTTNHTHVWGSGGTTTIVGAAAATGTGTATICSNQVVTAISGVAAPTCTTVTSAFTDNTVAHTGVDISTAHKVVALQGVSVDSTTPTDGQFLIYNNASSKWKPTTYAGASASTGIQKGNGSGGFAQADSNDLSAPHICVATFSTGVFSCNLSPAISSYTSGLTVTVIPGTTGAATAGNAQLNVNSLGAVYIRSQDGGLIEGGLLTTKYPFTVTYVPLGGGINEGFVLTGRSSTLAFASCLSTTNTGNAYTCSGWAPTLMGLPYGGTAAVVRFNAANTGASTLTWNGVGSPVPIKHPGGADVASQEIAANKPYLLFYDGTNLLLTVTSVGGDLAGPSDNATVQKIQGRTVATTAPSNGQVLVWNSGTSQWEPQAQSGSGISAFNQTLDFACSYTSSTRVTCSWPSGGTNFSSNGYVVNAHGSSCTIDLASPAGAANFMARMDPASWTVVVDTSAANFTGVTIGGSCSQGATGVTAGTFPVQTKPLVQLTTAGSNTWDSFSSCLGTNTSGCIDKRAALSVDVTVAGTGLTSTIATGTNTMAVDRSMVPFFYTGSGAPGTITGSKLGDLYDDSTGHVLYACTGGTNPCTTWTSSSGGGGGSGANANGYYLVAQSTNAPVNAVNLGALTTGILKISVSAGVATPSTAVAGDFPTLNQNTTGTAANVTGVVAEANGGTGSNVTTGAAGHVLRSNGTHYVDSAIQSGDLPTALQNGTTGTTQSANDNSTKIATTAYVDTAVSNGASSVATGTLTQSQVVALATPVQVIAAPGAGKMIVIESFVLEHVFNTAAYSTGQSINLRYVSDGSGSSPVNSCSASLLTATATATCQEPPIAITNSSTMINQPIVLGTLGGTTPVCSSTCGNLNYFVKYHIQSGF